MELVNLFERLSLEEAAAIDDLRSARANRAIDKRRRVAVEMRHRKPDQRTALFALYAHRHPRVRFNVATSTYLLNPEKARAILTEIAESRRYPWVVDAKFNLMGLNDDTSALLRDPE